MWHLQLQFPNDLVTCCYLSHLRGELYLFRWAGLLREMGFKCRHMSTLGHMSFYMHFNLKVCYFRFVYCSTTYILPFVLWTNWLFLFGLFVKAAPLEIKPCGAGDFTNLHIIRTIIWRSPKELIWMGNDPMTCCAH